MLFSAVAISRPAPWPKWDDSTRLDFGKCLYAEDSSATDWSALGWALIKQWRLKKDRIERHTFHRQVRWYCAVFERGGPRWATKRPGRILAASWKNPPYKRDLAIWRRLEKFVGQFERRQVSDPCPSCVWWGGPKCDLIPEHWQCPLGPPETRNMFCHLEGHPGR